MADCHKCGGRIKHRQPDGRRKCKHCGFSAGNTLLSRSGEQTAMTDRAKPAPDLGRIGQLAEELRCAARSVTGDMVQTPAGDAYEYRGSTQQCGVVASGSEQS